MVSIRLATIDDAEQIASLSQQTFFETFAEENTRENMEKFLNEQFTKGKLMLEVGRNENIFLLAYAGNEIAGYVKLSDAKKPPAFERVASIELARLYVVKKMIGKRVGQALMQNSLDIAEELKKELVWLGVWEKNTRAIDFYKKWGFEKFDEWDFLLGDDLQKDWLMKKELSNNLLK
jgi:diamine N-acetyltransferase